MDPVDFTPDSPGQLIRASEGYWAFVPDPLPPPLQFDLAAINLLVDAQGALSELSGLGRGLPNPHLLVGPFMRREAVLSSRIEGTVTRVDQLMRFEVEPSIETQTPDLREVLNYVRALEYGLDRLPTLPMSLRLVREIHGQLLRGVRGRQRRPGEFRDVQNAVGTRADQSYAEARYVPPPVPHMRSALSDFENFLVRSSDLPLLIELALIHYQFEAIHPFMDGNGRIGRLLMSIVLCDQGALPSPLLYLSAFFERHREAYVDHLLAVSQRGSWLDWIGFFLQGVAEQARSAGELSTRLLDLREDYRTRVQAARRSALPLRLIDDLFASPYLTVPIAAGRLNVTQRSASLNISKLVDLGIVVEITGRQRYRVFEAFEVVQMLSADID